MQWRLRVSSDIGEIKALLLASREARSETDRKIDGLITDTQATREAARNTARQVLSIETRLDAIEAIPRRVGKVLWKVMAGLGSAAVIKWQTDWLDQWPGNWFRGH